LEGSLFSCSVALDHTQSYCAAVPLTSSGITIRPGRNQCELVSANSSVNLPFDFSIHPAWTSRLAYHSRNTSESVSPYTGCSNTPLELYLLGHATSTISNTIPLVYPRMNDPMNEHRLVMNDSWDTFFSPFSMSNSPHRNMSLRSLLEMKYSTSYHDETIRTTSLRSFLRV